MKKSLGRGLANILQSDETTQSLEHNIVLINIEDILYNPKNPRKYINEEYISQLANTILEHGLLHPVLVKKQGNQFIIIAGERRVRAFKKINKKEVPCIIKEVNEQENLELSLIENIQREQIGPIEEANVYQVLIEKYNFTQKKLSHRMGKNRTVITNKLRLLNLPEQMQEDLSLGILTEGQLRPLLSIKEKAIQKELHLTIKKENWSARKIEEFMKKYHLNLQKSKPSTKEKSYISKDVNIEALEKELSEEYHRNIQIQYSSKSKKGKIIFNFYALDDFEQLFQKIKKR